MSLLSIEDLSVVIGGRVAALSNVSFTVDTGEVVGLVGESGGGKSMVGRAVVGMLPTGSVATGRVDFDGVDVLSMSAERLAQHRGHGAALCFQNPRGALSPTRTAGRQLVDRLTTHQRMDDERADETALELFEAVGIRSARRRLGAYPHELSGGMAQRVMISLATGCAPRLLIADEPTTGLDVTLTTEILRQFRHAADNDGRGVLLVSHDINAIADVCDRIVVLYAGTVAETGPARRVLTAPAHPYTRALLRSVPDLGGRPVVVTPGAMPLLREAPDACPFAPRCAHAEDDCRASRPALTTQGRSWTAACFHPLRDGVDARQEADVTLRVTTRRPGKAPAAGPVLVVDDAHVVYKSRFGRGGHHALRGVSLTVDAGERVGVVGESGCGKSTLARLIVGLAKPTGGTVKAARSALVFQDPIGSLSPRRTIEDAIGEPLRALGVPAAERARRAAAVLDRMKLDRSILGRRPHELSGGQAQRVGIARALVAEPDLIVFDEPTSALDVTVQAQILAVIDEVAADRSHGSVFISHDLATVRGFADRVVVLYLGRIVEEGPVGEVFADPRHPYTRALLSRGVTLVRDLEEADATSGCALAARCPFATDRCRAEDQQLQQYGESRAACWRVPEIGESV
ncbi:ABC transporter ATP-binding protein [Dactylosporangium fulvum]|uniref:ABC transporter ATP-binding protein n=1 Tax=Dactylosporangium fulvum TaxID=53359 RepID=A0ABY5VMM4_9ACTN|nr:ABC transporter ATP-binding protein [Dactylosporangium fulvum]UWP78948.1 ABC transporter ATP-binding protein [Dactylosporangium fulvum]